MAKARRKTSCPFHFAKVPTRPTRMTFGGAAGKALAASRSSFGPSGENSLRSTAFHIGWTGIRAFKAERKSSATLRELAIAALHLPASARNSLDITGRELT